MWSFAEITNWLKRLLPYGAVEFLRRPYYFLGSLIANLIYGFPSRDLRFIGVTGTTGKTITTNLINNIIETSGYRTGMISSATIRVSGESRDNKLAYTTPGPFKLQALLRQMSKENVDWVIMEVSSHALDQGRVRGIKFDIAVLTNLSKDHLNYHQTMHKYAASKAKLLQNYPKLTVLNRDDEWYDYFNKFEAEQKISFGTDAKADCRILEAKLGSRSTNLHLALDDVHIRVDTKLVGRFNAYNTLAAASTTYGMGIDVDDIKHGLSKTEKIPGRVEEIDEGQDFRIIVDRAHTPQSLKNLLEATHLSKHGKLITVLGAYADHPKEDRLEMGEIVAEASQVSIFTSQETIKRDTQFVRNQLEEGARLVPGKKVLNIDVRREAIKKALSFAKPGDMVLVLGLGDQSWRHIHGEKRPWDDRLAVRQELAELMRQK